MGELSAGEKSFLFSVMPYVDYLSCGIVIDGKETLTTGELADFLGMSKPTVLKSLNSLNEKKLIARCYTGGRGYKYLLNPWLCVKGRMINATLKHIFGEYRVRSRGGRMWKEI